MRCRAIEQVGVKSCCGKYHVDTVSVVFRPRSRAARGLFDWLAAHAMRRAKGSTSRLFVLLYAVGVVVTVFLLNDATAVVLTPAIYAAAKAAKAESLPYLFICALVANAASFVLPISDPVNLAVFARHIPPLRRCLARFALPSLLSIAAAFAVLRLTQHSRLREEIDIDMEAMSLSKGGKAAGLGIVLTGVTLIASSALNLQLGSPTFVAGLTTVMAVFAIKCENPWGDGVRSEGSWQADVGEAVVRGMADPLT